MLHASQKLINFEEDVQSPKIKTHQHVGIEKDALGVVGKAPAVQLSESTPQLRPTEQLQVSLIVGVQLVYDYNSVVNRRKQVATEAHGQCKIKLPRQ